MQGNPFQMSFYADHILPHLINFACSREDVDKKRAKVVPYAEGHVLEVGMGSGLNIPFYDPDKIECLWGLEPSKGMRMKAAPNIRNAPFEIRMLELPGEEIPLEDESVDTVLLTFTLCTIPDWHTALTQMRRVLKPGGKLLFCEHGEAPDKAVRKWQDRINPFWKKLAGGCNLNRPIPSFIEQGGFNITEIESAYMSSPKFASFNYWGSAGKA